MPVDDALDNDLRGLEDVADICDGIGVRIGPGPACCRILDEFL